MNNTINIANTSPSKTSESGSSHSKNASLEGLDGAETKDSSANAGSFKDSIKKVYDESKQSEDKVDNEISGNNLPVSDDLSELSAKDDRALSPAGFNVMEQLPAKTKPTEQNTAAQPQALPLEIDTDINVDEKPDQLSSSLATDKNIIVDGKLNVMSSQVRQLLKMEANTDTKNVQSGHARAAVDNTETINIGSEKTFLQQTEILPLNTEQFAVMSDKSQVLANAANQQQILPNIQTSSSIQTISAQADPGIDSLPLITNATVNSYSAMNLQSVPQVEIAEAFGRPAWSQAMGKQILLMVNQNIGSAEIRLNPAHLGPIEVLIDMSDDQVNVSMSSRHGVVREAMEQALPKLREMLDENGFTLADTDISKHSFAEQREQNTESNRTSVTSDSIDQPVISEISDQAMNSTTMATGMVDYYI